MRRFALTFLLVSLLAGALFAAQLSEQTARLDPLSIQQKVVTNAGVTATLAIDEPLWLTAGDEANPLEVAEFPLSGKLNTVGQPAVPIASSLFRIPPRSGVVVEVLEADYTTYTNVEYAAYYGSGELDHLGPPEEVVDEWFPGTLAEVGSPAIFGDFRVANLKTYPVQVNTARNEVRVYNRINVQIRYEGVDERNALDHWPTRISEARLPLYRQFMDWDDEELDDYVLYRGNVIVVMEDDPVLWTMLASWIEWKQQKGWTLEFLTDDDVGSWSANSIRNELQDRWDEAEVKYDYIVIIGDDQGSWPVPAGSGGMGSYNGDHLYSCVAGNDNLADVGLGRISVMNNTDVTVYRNKVFNYEKEPYMDDTDWYLRGMVNRSDNYQGVSKIFLLRWWRNVMLRQLGFTQVDTSWGVGNGTATSAINNGVSFYGARGYIGTGLLCGAINNLNNDYKTPMVIDVTCGTGNWSGGEGINECYMRAGTASIPRGGIGGMSMATSATNPEFNHVLAGASGWAMLQLQMPHMGDMMLAAKVNGWKNYHGHDDGGLNNFNTWYNQMGDPTVMLWTGIPQDMDAEADASIELGQNSYSVSVTGDEGPVENAWVTFYKVDDDEEIVVTKYTDENGEVTLDAPVRYAGEATLTVTRQHHVPYIMEVDVVDPTSRVGYVDISYVDDGSEGTDGDGDGIPEAGETVGLELTVKNWGNITVTNISFSGTSEDEWVNSVSGSATVTSLAANAQTTADGVILVEIDPSAQHDWLIELDLEADTDAGTFTDGAQITVQAPHFALVEADLAGSLDPGTTRSLSIEVENVGGSVFTGGSCDLLSRDPYVRIVDGEATYNGINPGGTATGAFMIQGHEDALPGYRAILKLAMNGNNGTTDTIFVPITVGNRTTTDPAGPDRYGYFAFDETDTDYEDFAPTYDWVEIDDDVNGYDFVGNEIDIQDPTENDDEAAWVVLPFSVQYYGETFDTITVSTNGFLAMGDQSNIPNNRNWTIPSPIGPNYMIAPYWDELRTDNQSRILYYHDQQNGRFIVEWSKMKHNSNNRNTFQVIIYDQSARPTWTGDNDILFQYHTVNHYGSDVMQYDIPYWTTGIENYMQDDGILIAYWNDYAPGAAEIEEESAILFTTNIPMIVGHVSGRVTDLETGDPIVGAHIHTADYLFEAVSDSDGYYFIENFVIGEWELDVNVDCYNDQYDLPVTIIESETLMVDLEMTHPEFDIQPEELTEELIGDDQTTQSLMVYNPGNGPMTFSTYVGYQDPADAAFTFEYGGVEEDGVNRFWAPVYNAQLEDYEYHHRGVAFDGEYFWVSGSNNYDVSGPNKLYQYTYRGEYVATFDQPVPAEDRSSQGFYGLDWDGEYLYGADGSIVYKMQFDESANEWVALETYELPVNPPCRYLTVDPETNIFYVGDYGTEIRVAHPDSADVLAEFGQGFHPRGATWVADDPDGYNLYMIARNMGDDEGQILKFNPTTGEHISLATFDNSFIPAGASLTNAWNPQIWTIASIMDGGDFDGIQLWNAGLNEPWLEIADPEGYIEGDDSLAYDIILSANNMASRDYEMYLNFDHSACIEFNDISHVTLVVPTVIGEEDDSETMPLEWAFDGAYPNPFNPSTTVAFTLKEATTVQLRVFNVLGQQVKVLANRAMRAGHHQVPFQGHDMASGIYFVRFDAGPLHETRKVVLMK